LLTTLRAEKQYQACGPYKRCPHFISLLHNPDFPVAQHQQTPPTGDDVAGSTIFKKFLGKAEGYIKQPTRLKELLTDAYKKASEKNEVGTLAHEAWETLQTLFRLIKAAMSGEYTGVPTATVLAAVAVLIYFLSPIDVIPDFIPVLGLLDDVALVAWFSTTLKTELDKFHEWELTRPQLAEAPPAAKPEATAEETTQATHYNAAARHGHADAAEAALKSMDTPATGKAKPSAPIAAEAAPASDELQPSDKSAKNAGTEPASEVKPDVAATTTDSSREPNTGTVDTGGNVR
jgi:uncharacterized membrane protein YkvA (DUF1232 family)